ncbi:Glutamyl-tRNA synthetase [Kockovaella imperatae]|uniref:Glutamate--tRNA ligase, mitochondrial n=1 Tax=Kockovaella imperatae TaxID=4999 RepID=A0A1Y1UAZ0_9TREE|nr:Glutamyl-tRNA synthetase [Kockovaella imperatae]ORX34714.1 Glutamyl-tRNA synthetase [Kockovaella imperatae]
MPRNQWILRAARCSRGASRSHAFTRPSQTISHTAAPFSTTRAQLLSASDIPTAGDFEGWDKGPKTYGPSSAPPRLRFAPSPTGYLHLGGLRTALINHIVARQGKGKWVLRVEDTDRERLVPGSIEQMRKTLEWAGLDYDEGPGVGGSFGPYYQSERLELYQQYVKQLLESDQAYECFCSPEDLAAIRAAGKNRGAQMNYDGRCRRLTDEDRVRRKKAGHSYTVRFKDPGKLPDMPVDLIFGHIKAHTDTGTPETYIPDDFILLKSDGYPTYHMASVVDDHAMEISHVIRGEDWIPSLPKHMSLYRALGWEPPQFAHLSLLVNPDGSKMSKRQDHVSAEWYREQGFEPEALNNYLAVLGWDYTRTLEEQLDEALPPNERKDLNSLHEVFTLPQLINAFDLTHLTRRKASINMDKLDFLNKMHLRLRAGLIGQDGHLVNYGKGDSGVDPDILEKRRGDMVQQFQRDLKANPDIADHPDVNDRGRVAEIFEFEMPRVRRFRELSQNVSFWFKDPSYTTEDAEKVLKAVGKDQYILFLEFIIPRLERIADDSHHFNKDDGWILANRAHNQLGLKRRGGVLKAMRHALTGQDQGPSVPDIMMVLGPETTLRRMKAGLDYVKARSA